MPKEATLTDAVPFDHAKLSAARLQACDRWPYFASGLLAMHVVEAPGLGTFGVDEHWRLYIDPEALKRWSVAQVAVVLNHELQHLLRNHAERARTLSIDYNERFAWNLAADAEINDDLFDELDAAMRKSLPAVTPKTLKQPPGQMAEFYFQQIRDGSHSGFDEGSGVHGFPSDHFPACDDEVAVRSTEAAVIRRGVAAAVRHHATGQSNVGAGLQRWAEATLGFSQDWRVILAGAVRRQCAQIAGLADYSYTRISRRGGSHAQILLPSMIKPAMSIAVVIDTSASVNDQLLGDALRELAAIARSVGERGATTHVIACDAASSRPAVVEAARSLSGPLIGGGGTDMRVGISTALEIRPRPHAVVVLTDGHSPWPSQQPAVPVIVGILGKARSNLAPSWATKVSIEPG